MPNARTVRYFIFTLWLVKQHIPRLSRWFAKLLRFQVVHTISFTIRFDTVRENDILCFGNIGCPTSLEKNRTPNFSQKARCHMVVL